MASGTASNVIAGRPGVSQAKQAAVRDAALKLNYRPSSIARALSKRQSDMIGVLTRGFCGAYISRALDVAERETRLAGKHIVVGSSLDRNDTASHDDEALAFLDGRDCDGILVIGGGWSEYQLAQLAARTKPIALVNRQLALCPDISFCVDHYSAGRSIADYLLRQGHREFAAIKGCEHFQDATLRYKGFAEGIAAAGFALHPQLIEEDSFGFAGGKRAAERLLASGRSFTAICCGDDLQAIAVESVLTTANHTAMIFGYGGWDLSDLPHTRICTVSEPVADLVRNACACLLNACYGGDRPVIHAFPTSLIVGEAFEFPGS